MKNLFTNFTTKKSLNNFICFSGERPSGEIQSIKAEKQKQFPNQELQEIKFHTEKAYHVAKNGLDALNKEVGGADQLTNINGEIKGEIKSLYSLLKSTGLKSDQCQLVGALLTKQGFRVDRFYKNDKVSIQDGKLTLSTNHMNNRFFDKKLVETNGFDENQFIDKEAGTITISLVGESKDVIDTAIESGTDIMHDSALLNKVIQDGMDTDEKLPENPRIEATEKVESVAPVEVAEPVLNKNGSAAEFSRNDEIAENIWAIPEKEVSIPVESTLIAPTVEDESIDPFANAIPVKDDIDTAPGVGGKSFFKEETE